MTKHPKLPSRKVLAAAAAGTLTLVVAVPGLAAAAGLGTHESGTSAGAHTSVAETVQVVMNADGKVSTSRLYTQITASGTGSVHLDVPSPHGLRDLDGYSAPDVTDGHARYRLTPADGSARTRTVGDFDKDLPVEVGVTYTLDGKPVQAADVVGKSGVLVATYHIENATAAERTVTYQGGDGKDVTETVKTVVPLVGTLSTTLPGRFTQVSAPDAAVGGDGRGDNQVQWSLVLFDPVGSPTADVSYSARITDGEVPATKLQLAVVAPEDMAATRSAGEQYADGAKTGADLTDGATQIDENLLKLKSGAGQLLAGLQKLSDGASQLSDGLNGQAVPGSKKLADGASKLHHGANDLSDGLDQLSGGLTTLNGKLPAAVAAVHSLTDGADQILAGLGTASNDTTLIGGAHALKGGLLLTKGGVAQVKTGIDGAVSNFRAKIATGADLDQLAGGISALSGYCGVDPVCQAKVAGLAAAVNGPGATSLKTQLTAAANGAGPATPGLQQASDGLGQVLAGLGDESTDHTLINGATKLELGLGMVKAGVYSGDPEHPGVKDGLLMLSSALSDAVTGVGQLSDGAHAAAAGGQQLAGGAGQVSAGADQLAKGLAPAGAGAKQIADGLGQATPGAAQIEDGAGRLSAEGTKKLIEAGEDTTSTFGSKYGQIVALNERAQESQLAYGNVATGADTQTSVFSYELAGANSDSQANVVRAVVAALALVAGAAIAAVARRFRRRA